MIKTRITDQDGEMVGWFDEEKAEHWAEGTRWDGNNNISLSTGSQWNHERMYRSRKGRWILNSWSQWQGSQETYERITKDQAAEWFIKNERQPPDELAEVFNSMEL